jgi:TonB family protein
MRSLLIAFVFSTFCLSAWSQKKEYLNSEFVVIEEESVSSYTRTSTLKDGLYDVTITFLGGQLFMTGKYMDEKLEMPHGHFVFYNQNGNKEAEGDYHKGMKVGTWKRWNAEGAPMPDRAYQKAPEESVAVNKENSNKSTTPAGFADLDNYIEKNLRYPEKAIVNGAKGTVYLSFVIRTDGSVKNPKVTQGINPELDAAAMQFVMGMPAWTPGQRNGNAIESEVILPITFE